jgi:hypothetical protein
MLLYISFKGSVVSYFETLFIFNRLCLATERFVQVLSKLSALQTDKLWEQSICNVISLHHYL